jgi:Protein of unknown function (DUF2905)
MAKSIIIIGSMLVLVGIVLYFFPNAFKWFGNLPGDFKFEGENSSFYFPLTSMIVVSVVLNILFRLVNYWKG